MKLLALAFWNLHWGSGTEVDQKGWVFEKIVECCEKQLC